MDGFVASANTDGSPCQHDESSVDAHAQISGYSGTRLSEEIWRHIHSLMPMRDAAQVACVARAFLCSWRCYPNLDFSEEALTTENLCENEEMSRDIISSRVDHILRNHSGIGVKKLKFEVDPLYEKQLFSHHDLDRWLHNTVKPGIEELKLCLDQSDSMYNFPCSLLSDEIGDSLQYLQLLCCNFHPTSRLGCLRSLTGIELTTVSITENELECLLSKSSALEWFELFDCSGIVHLKIPCLQKLNYFKVSADGLEELEIMAPNVSSVSISVDLPLQISLPESSRIKESELFFSGALSYARTSLPSSMPNLETLDICSGVETVSTPVMPSKFLHLKFLKIVLIGQKTYDYLSLLSFLDASPSLETFILNVFRGRMQHVAIFEDSSGLRKMPENHYDKLKRVQIINFSCAKSLVELTSYIVESASSLESLTLDTTYGVVRCSDTCTPISRYELVEAQRSALAARKYIKPKVPSTVEFNIVEPCRRCHGV